MYQQASVLAFSHPSVANRQNLLRQNLLRNLLRKLLGTFSPGVSDANEWHGRLLRLKNCSDLLKGFLKEDLLRLAHARVEKDGIARVSG